MLRAVVGHVAESWGLEIETLSADFALDYSHRLVPAPARLLSRYDRRRLRALTPSLARGCAGPYPLRGAFMARGAVLVRTEPLPRRPGLGRAAGGRCLFAALQSLIGKKCFAALQSLKAAPGPRSFVFSGPEALAGHWRSDSPPAESVTRSASTERRCPSPPCSQLRAESRASARLCVASARALYLAPIME
jgi:hypothetical protein